MVMMVMPAACSRSYKYVLTVLCGSAVRYSLRVEVRRAVALFFAFFQKNIVRNIIVDCFFIPRDRNSTVADADVLFDDGVIIKNRSVGLAHNEYFLQSINALQLCF